MEKWELEYIVRIRQFESKKIYIYGAGKVGTLISEICNKNNIKFEGFCVSELAGNKEAISGKPVFLVDNITCEKNDVLFLVAVMERGEKKIEKRLSEMGFKYWIPIPDNVLLSDPLERKRIQSPIIEVTPVLGCAVNCRFCPQQVLAKNYYMNDSRRSQIMSLSEYIHMLENLPKRVMVDYSGFVEPFLHPHAVDMIEETITKGFHISLYTTFRGLTREGFDRIKQVQFDSVVWHTPDIDGYASIPMNDEYFDIIREAVCLKKKDGSPFIDQANCQSKPHPKILDITKGRIKIYCEMQDRAGNMDNFDNLSHANIIGANCCSIAPNLDHNVLLPDGTLVLCCNDFGLKYVLGNLFETKYEEVMSSSRVKSIHELTGNGQNSLCQKCVFARKKV